MLCQSWFQHLRRWSAGLDREHRLVCSKSVHHSNTPAYPCRRWIQWRIHERDVGVSRIRIPFQKHNWTNISTWHRIFSRLNALHLSFNNNEEYKFSVWHKNLYSLAAGRPNLHGSDPEITRNVLWSKICGGLISKHFLVKIIYHISTLST